MARWRLKGKHYLRVPDTFWQHEEVDRDTGRAARKLFPVPMYLDPDIGTDCNYPGEIIVAYEGKGLPKDIVFMGPPTPDMDPLDDEAKEITDSLKGSWIHPIDSLPGEYGQSILTDLQRQVDDLARNQVPTKPVPSISLDQFQELQGQVKALMEQNASLVKQLGAKRV